MPIRVINGVNSPTNTSGFTSGNPVYVLDTVPTARAAANGLRPIRISGLHLDFGGVVTFGVWNADGSEGAGAPAAVGGGFGRYSSPLSKYIPVANLQDIRVGWFSPQGSINFGRAAVAGRTVEDGYGGYGGSSLTGLWTYEEVPAAPTMLDATPGPAGAVRVRFSGSGDTGDAPITGWKLQRSENAAFTVGVVTVDSGGTTDFTLTPGKTYWFRAAGRNNVADAYGTTGPWAGAIAATMRSGGQIRNGAAWKPSIVKIRSGGVWKDAIIKIRSGGTWKDVA